MAYFITIYEISNHFISMMKIINEEAKVICNLEPNLNQLINYQRELIYNKTKTIRGRTSMNYTQSTLTLVYTRNRDILDKHFFNRDFLKD